VPGREGTLDKRPIFQPYKLEWERKRKNKDVGLSMQQIFAQFFLFQITKTIEPFKLRISPKSTFS
jgi:hypothetical protein